MAMITLQKVGNVPDLEIDSGEVKAYLTEIMYAAQRHMAIQMAMSRGGDLYRKSNPTRLHRASAGRRHGRIEFPAVDTGRLRAQTTNPSAIDVRGTEPRWIAEWGTQTSYAKWLAPADEGGESRGPKRKFMRASVDAVIDKIEPPDGMIKVG